MVGVSWLYRTDSGDSTISRTNSRNYSPSTVFAFQAFITWAVLCLPGNLTTFFLLATIDEENWKYSIVDYDLPGNKTYNFNVELECHEKKEDYSSLKDTVHYWIAGIGIFSIGAFGLVGNAITIVTLYHIKTNRNFNKLLMALAIVDFMLILEMIIEVAIVGVFIIPEPLWFIKMFPHVIHPGRGILTTADIFLTIAVSIERYKAICKPLTPRHPVYLYLIFVVLISFTLEIPLFFEFETNPNGTDYWTTFLNEEIVYIRMNSFWNELLVTGILPIIILVYLNVKIYAKIMDSSGFTKRFARSIANTLSSPSMKNSRNEDLSGFGSFMQNFRRPSSPRTSEPSVMIPLSLLGKSKRKEKAMLQSNKTDKFNQIGDSPTECIDETATFSLLSPTDLSPRFDKNRSQLQTEMTKTVDHLFPNVIIKDETEPYQGGYLERFKDENSSVWKEDVNSPITLQIKRRESRCMLPSFISQRSGTFNLEGQSEMTQYDEQEEELMEIYSIRKRPQSEILRKRHEKSTVILVLVVLVFFLCHIYRLLFRIFQMTHTERTIYVTYHMCLEKGRYQVPVVVYMMADLHYFFLTINSSVNFLIYCCVSQEFRKQMIEIFSFRRCQEDQTG